MGKEWEMEVLPQVPHGASTPVFEDVQVCLPFVLQDERETSGVLLTSPSPPRTASGQDVEPQGCSLPGLSSPAVTLSSHPCASPRATAQPPAGNPLLLPLWVPSALGHGMLCGHQKPSPILHPSPAPIPLAQPAPGDRLRMDPSREDCSRMSPYRPTQRMRG